MPPLPESSSSGQASEAVMTLEAGLAAFKQGDYPKAVSLLEAAIPHVHQHPLLPQAQKGLIIAYARNDQPDLAFHQCQVLSQCADASLQAWAVRTLEALVKRHPHLQAGARATSNQPGGFTVADSTSATIDPTGFTPFDPSAQQPVAAERPSIAEVGQRSTEVEPSVRHNERRGQPAFSPSAGSNPSVPPNRPDIAGGRRDRTPSPATDAPPPPVDYQPTWRQAKRAKQWPRLGLVKQAVRLRLWLTQGITAIALFWVMQQIVFWPVVYYTVFLTLIPFLGIRRDFFSPPVWPIVLLLVGLFLASRWILDGLLATMHGLQPLTSEQLTLYSPESTQLIQQFAKQKRIRRVDLGLLPTQAPIVMTYGCLPRFTRIVVSQGVLKHLADDEIATLVAAEIGHLTYGTVPLMSLLAVVMQLPYTLYQIIAEWGNRHIDSTLVRGVAAVLSALCYGFYWLMRGVGLWLSRRRILYSDRVAVDLTGNPNGLTRALLKLAIHTASVVKQTEQTPYLIESTDLLTPLGHGAAVTLGGLYPHTPIQPLLEWERTNPYRHWLAINQSHPPTGDRLYVLARYAQHWKLDMELNWQDHRGPAPTNQLTASQWRTLLLQGAPFFGFALGIGIAVVLQTLGWVGVRLEQPFLMWLYGDRGTLMGLPLIGFAVGTIIRINRIFPEIPGSPLHGGQSSIDWVAVMSQPTALPLDSPPIQISGTLIGRSGVSNALNQDLLLQTSRGLIKLHHYSLVGPVGNLLPQANHPSHLLQQPLVVSGWFRRGVTPWIDVETLRTPGGRVSYSYHPMWSTTLATIVALIGIFMILRGGMI